jgi:hypothetical protein
MVLSAPTHNRMWRSSDRTTYRNGRPSHTRPSTNRQLGVESAVVTRRKWSEVVEDSEDVPRPLQPGLPAKREMIRHQKSPRKNANLEDLDAMLLW